MKCPNCKDIDLLMSERKGIEIDYCPSCRGIWLDRGELDKFIQQAEEQVQANSFEKAPSSGRSRDDHAHQFERSEDDDRKYTDRKYENREFRDDDRQYPRYGKKKESFWSNLFDFD